MERIKSIDIIRGISICWMIINHLQRGWLIWSDYWVVYDTWKILDVMGVCAFLFISGVSSMISFKKRLKKAESSKEYTLRTIKNEYIFRALILLVIALTVNIILAIVNNNAQWVLAWQFLLTLSVSLLLAWPFLRTSKSFRVVFGASLWIFNQILLHFLTPYINQPNLGGLIYYLLYTTSEMDSILIFFTFFLMGTVVGELIFEFYQIENKTERIKAMKSKLLLPSYVIGAILIISGVFFNFPEFLNALYRSFPWMIYSLGIHLILLSTLIYLEENGIFQTKKEYRFLFYFSYYSFTVYGSHYILVLLFEQRLNAFNIWIFIIITIILYNTLFRIAYKTVKHKVSMKAQINIISVKLARIIEERKRIKDVSLNQ